MDTTKELVCIYFILISRIVKLSYKTYAYTSNTRRDHQQRTKKTDRQLQLMLLVQVILLAVFSLPLAGQKLYVNLTVYDSTTALQVAINNFVYNFALQLTFVANGMPFYIYTLSGGSVFRKAFSELVQSVYGKITCRRM
jgi:hypothetical protein